jgi:predicted RNA binding protein YcfA (HicA-like mRNA interferase family)
LNDGQFIRIIEAHGFVLHQQAKGSHCIYRGNVAGEALLIAVAAHRDSEDIKPGTLNATIPQSGPSKALFR